MSDATDPASEFEPPRAAGAAEPKPAADRTDLWLPLLRRLTEASPVMVALEERELGVPGHRRHRRGGAGE